MQCTGSGVVILLFPLPQVASPSRTQKFVEPIMEGSSFWPLPLRRVENGRSLLPTESLSTCKRADCKKLKKGSWPVSHATLWLLLSNFSNDPLAALGDRRFKAKSDNIDKVLTALTGQLLSFGMGQKSLRSETREKGWPV